MRDYYVFDVTKHKTSKFDGKPYFEIDIVGVDPADKLLKHYRTYAVTTYKNYKNWMPIINARADKIAVWFSGDMKLKLYEDNMINADSKPYYEGAISTDKLLKFFQHNINIGAIKTGTVERDLSEIGKLFFEV